jgi:hypothetical protein
VKLGLTLRKDRGLGKMENWEMGSIPGRNNLRLEKNAYGRAACFVLLAEKY